MHVWLLTTNNAVAFRPDGKFYEFGNPVSGNVYTSEADVPDTLTKVVNGSGVITGWKYTVATNDTVENYDATGNLTSIILRNGQTTTFTYSTFSTSFSIAPAPGLLITVIDHFGRALQLIYYDSARIKSATDPVGNVVYFYYDESSSVVVSGQQPANNLTSIEFPGSHKRVFYYNEQANTASTNLPNALTGIEDENNSRFATYQYDVSGRAVSSEHAGGVEHYSVAYNGDGNSTVTDPLNAARTNGYQIVQLIPQTISVSGPACPACGPTALTYDSNGFLSSQTDWNGNFTTYLRQDPNGRLDLETSRTEALGSPVARTITTQWHLTFRLPALITEPGRTTAFTYDTSGNMLTKTVTDTVTSAARTWTYTYNSIGQMLTVDGPRTDVSDVTTYAYDSATGNLLSVTNATSHVTQITSHDANGRPLTIVDPNGLTTTLTYAPRGWLTSRTVGGEITTYDYDFVGQLTKVTVPASSFLEYVYDPAHRLTEIHDNLGNKIVYTLDAMGNRTQEDVRDPSGRLAQTRSRIYDSLNRLIKDIGGTNPAAQVIQYGYDNQGNLTTITDPLQHVTTNSYDALNRLKQVTDPGLGLTQYGYNALDQLTAVTDQRNNATTYSVDALDNLNQQTSPDTGTSVNTYDAAGNVLTSRDAKNQTTTYTYDALNRVTRITYHDASQVNYTYDQGMNGKGRLSSIVETAAGGALTAQMIYAYDAHGRMTSETRILGTGAYLTQYSYDAAGRLSSMTYPSGRQVVHSFDAAGRIVGITTTTPGGSAQTVVANVAYHPFGGAKSFTYGNGQTYTRTIDLDGRIAGYTFGTQSMSVGFDAASRITSIAQSAGPGNTYGYDALDRLTSAVMPSASQSFGYDPVGNRTNKTVGAGTAIYAYSATNNQLSSITSGVTRSFGHDANGSIVNDGANSFTYDLRGRLVQAATALGSVSYGINSLGQRYAKTVQGVSTLFHYDTQGHLIAETNSGGNTLVEYLYLGDIPVAIWR